MIPAMQPLLSRQAVELYRSLEPARARKASPEPVVAAMLDLPTMSGLVGVPKEAGTVLGPVSGRVFARGVAIRVGGQESTGQPAILASTRSGAPGSASSSYPPEPPAPGGLLDVWR